MLVDFKRLQQVKIPHLNDGEGTVTAKMFTDSANKIMISRIPAGASIGTHRHTTSSEMNYAISGEGKAICDGREEFLQKGDCHYCPKGSCHSIQNTGEEDLILFTVVAEQ